MFCLVFPWYATEDGGEWVLFKQNIFLICHIIVYLTIDLVSYFLNLSNINNFSTITLTAKVFITIISIINHHNIYEYFHKVQQQAYIQVQCIYKSVKFSCPTKLRGFKSIHQEKWNLLQVNVWISISIFTASKIFFHNSGWAWVTIMLVSRLSWYYDKIAREIMKHWFNFNSEVY